MIGLLLFIATLAFIPHYFYIILFVYACFARKKQIKEQISKNISMIIALWIFILCCLANILFHSAHQTIVEFPYVLLIPLSLIISFSITKKDLKIFVFLLCIEAAVGFFEFFTGINSIFPSYVTENSFDEEGLLYYKRVCGLSLGSSTYSLKLLLGLVLLDYIKDEFEKYYKWIKILLILGVVFSFNRTTLGVVIVYELIWFYKYLKSVFKSNLILALIVLSAFGIIIFLFQSEGEEIISQFTRGKGEIDLSGRPYIWSRFFEFINNNLMFGNGSYKFYVPYYSGMIHAHNSYIQFVANHGIIIGLFFFTIIISRIKSNNFLFIFPVLTYSLTQYGVFWGISLADIILFMFLCNKSILYAENKSQIN